MSLRTFMRLPALQRSAVILKDVLGHSLEEVASITGASEAAAKSALQRGRVRLREFAKEPADVSLPMLSDGMRARLTTYVEGFKIGDFDTVRAMLADDVKLDLVAKLRKQGKSEVGEYYAAYAAAKQWAYAAGVVDGRAAMLVYDREISLGTPAYLLPWISMAIAWPRSTTSCMPVMRWTVSTCPHSIPKRYHSKDGETVLLADEVHL